MTRPILGHEIIDKSTKRVEEKVLDHHLQDEDLGGVFPEGVPKEISD